MVRLIRYLKPYTVTIIVIVGLLFIQALSDLALPDYTSNIVNVGIQQGGIENAVPKIIRKVEFDRLLLFVRDNDKAEVKAHYRLLDKDNLPKGKLNGYLDKYPVLAKGALYERKELEEGESDRLNEIFGRPVLIVSGIEKNGLKGMTGNTQDLQQASPLMGLLSLMDPFVLLSQMPKDQFSLVQDQMDAKLKDMPESMITQSAITYLHDEYKAIGVDTDKLQSNYILLSGIKMLLIALIGAAATVVVGFLAARVAAGFSKILRENIFRKVVSFSSTEFDKFSTASLITRSTNDIQQVMMFMVMLIRMVFYAPILGVGGVLKVLNTDTSMGWVIAVAVGAIMILVFGLFSVAIPKFKSIQKYIDKLNLVTRESLTGMLVIRAFNTQKYEEKKFDNANQTLTNTFLFTSRLMSVMFPAMMIIMNGVMLLIIWVGAHQVDAGQMQVGDMMAFMAYSMQIIMSFLMISMVSMMMPRASVSAQRIAEVLDTEISVKDSDHTLAFPGVKRGYIEFVNVCFRYPGAEEDVLSNISFTAKPGEITAFIGSTGSGKSTLVNLIPRFYDVTSGEILIDGVDIRKVPQSALRAKIGYVSQKGVLFSGSIETNIRYGKQNASDDEMRKAAETAQAIEFINEKPEGFNAEIAQGGTNVSGGQKQRLSIARALVKTPEIYIFDDSFSALDYKTDAALRKALKAETEDSTVLIIAQRVSTIRHADRIIVLDEGMIVGNGTHEELMETCEVYKQIALSQLSKEELAS